jgi:hypothetical protein
MNTINAVPKMDGEPLEVSDVELNEETETPAESPTAEKPADNEEGDLEKKPEEEAEGEESPDENPEAGDDANDLERQVAGLKNQRDELLKDIQSKRAERRELRKPEAPQVPQPIPQVPQVAPETPQGEELDPEVASQLDAHLRNKGFVPKGEIEKSQRLQVVEQVKNDWLATHPEYLAKTGDDIWEAMQDELAQYKDPTNPYTYKNLLDRAHREVASKYPDRFPIKSGSPSAMKQRLQSAAMGSGGKGGSSKLRSSLSPAQVAELRRGGFNDEDIREIGKN